MANSVDPDQTAPIGAVCSGSTLFALQGKYWDSLTILATIIFSYSCPVLIGLANLKHKFF